MRNPLIAMTIGTALAVVAAACCKNGTCDQYLQTAIDDCARFGGTPMLYHCQEENGCMTYGTYQCKIVNNWGGAGEILGEDASTQSTGGAVSFNFTFDWNEAPTTEPSGRSDEQWAAVWKSPNAIEGLALGELVMDSDWSYATCHTDGDDVYVVVDIAEDEAWPTWPSSVVCHGGGAKLTLNSP